MDEGITMHGSILLLSGLLWFTGASKIGKRSFADLGCMGVYDKAKFSRLDRICDECYQMFRDDDVHTLCRSNCFKNNFFTHCVDALLLQQDQQQLGGLVDEMYGNGK